MEKSSILKQLLELKETYEIRLDKIKSAISLIEELGLEVKDSKKILDFPRSVKTEKEKINSKKYEIGIIAKLESLLDKYFLPIPTSQAELLLTPREIVVKMYSLSNELGYANKEHVQIMENILKQKGFSRLNFRDGVYKYGLKFIKFSESIKVSFTPEKEIINDAEYAKLKSIETKSLFALAKLKKAKSVEIFQFLTQYEIFEDKNRTLSNISSVLSRLHKRDEIIVHSAANKKHGNVYEII